MTLPERRLPTASMRSTPLAVGQLQHFIREFLRRVVDDGIRAVLLHELLLRVVDTVPGTRAPHLRELHRAIPTPPAAK